MNSNLFSITDPAGWLASSLFLLGLKSVAVLGLAGLAALFLRGSNAATRHLLWLSAMAGVLLLPVLGANLPARSIPGFLSWSVPAQTPAVAPNSSEPRTVSGIQSGSRPDLLLPPLPTSVGSMSGRSTSTVAAVGNTTQRNAPARGFPWPLTLSLLWLAGTLVVGLRLALCHRAAGGLTRRAQPFLSDTVNTQAARVAKELRLSRMPRVLMGEPGSMPMVIGWRRPALFLPPQAAEWSAQERRNVLLHEMAHIKRGDVAAQTVAHIACAVYWWNPLAWVAGDRLRHERELAADDCVLVRGAQPADYATQLLLAARSFHVLRRPQTLALPFAPRSHLRRRLTAVLTERPRGNPGWAVAVPLCIAATLLVSSVAALTPADTPERAESGPLLAGSPLDLLRKITRGHRRGTRVEEKDGNTHINSWTDKGDLEIKLRGEAEINDEETDIIGLSPNGKLMLSFDDHTTERRLTIRSDGDGRLTREWEINGKERAYDEEAREWLAEILPEMFRHTGYRADERVARLLRHGGVDGVLEEIESLPNNYVKRRYYAALLASDGLSKGQQADILNRAGEYIGSDYELAELLVRYLRENALTEAAQISIAHAASDLDSDYERGRALKTLVKESDLSPRAVSAVLDAAQGMDSDYELAEFLMAVTRLGMVTDEMSAAFFASAESIGSDYELRRVLDGMLRHGNLSSGVVVRMLNLAGESIDSNYELAELLVKVARTQSLDDAGLRAFRAAMHEVDSNHESAKVEQALRRHQGEN